MNLNIPFLKDDASWTVEERWARLKSLPLTALENNSWPTFRTSCSARFRVAHNGRNILISFTVTGDSFHTIPRLINEEVHLDNCIEFFISLGESDNYYNIEFNCDGIGKMGYGNGRVGRTLLHENVIRNIHCETRLSMGSATFDWEILLVIPVKCFVFDQIENLEYLQARGNFYKCADGLSAPHYLCWNTVSSPTPDFHQPDSFGGLRFKPQKINY